MTEIASLRPALAVAIAVVAVVPILATGRRPEGCVLAPASAFVVVVSMFPGAINGVVLVTHLGTLVAGVHLSLSLQADPLGLLFAAVASLLWLITAFYSIGYMRGLSEHAQTRYFASFVASVAATLGLALATNLVTLFVFYELLTAAMYPLVTHDGIAEARAAGHKYLSYTFGGGIAVLVSTVLVATTAGTTAFTPGSIAGLADADPVLARVAFVILASGFGVKPVLMSLHSWPPDADNSGDGTGTKTSDGSKKTRIEETDDDTSPSEAFSDALDAGDNTREEAANLSDRSHYDSALSALDRAEQQYREALDIAQSNGRLDGSEAESRLASIDDRRREIHRERLTAHLDTLREDLDRAENSIDSDPEDARERLTDLEGRIGDLDDEASEKGLDDLHEELAGLESERRTLFDDVSHSVWSGPPETIPDLPDVSVDYDALTDEKPIGAGGNADVVQATLPTPQGDIILAIKRPRMSGTLHTGTVERLLEEAETWDKLDDHDHIVGVVDYGAEPVPWIAMEYMDAGDLSERAGDLGFDQALWTAVAITRGVRHAHRRGVAHLDLKPANILFRSVEGAWDVPKVADWGLSKHLLEHSKSVEGLSPQYAAPEQFADEYGATDDITDVYQLGAVFYELFTGRPPFEGKPAKTMHRVLNEIPTPPSEVVDVPAVLDDVLLTALAKDKDNRFESVLYLRDALSRLDEDGYDSSVE
jgi:hypothetical protein